MTNELMVTDAIEYAAKCHVYQKRKWNGTPYINHPIRVAKNVSLIVKDVDVICSAYLHDVIEDCGIEYHQLEHRFSKNVADLVQSVTDVEFEGNRSQRKTAECKRISKCPYYSQILKLCDRLDNISEMYEDILQGKCNKSRFNDIYARESLMLVEYIGHSNRDISGSIIEISNNILNFNN
jgi:(p)ppGpp synthase/HD superfamily hydrolase